MVDENVKLIIRKPSRFKVPKSSKVIVNGELIDENEWGDAHHWLIYHGRRVCSSRIPKCGSCILRDLCRYYNESGK